MKTARVLSILAVAVVSSPLCFAQGAPTSPMNAKVGVWREGFLWVLDVNGDGQFVAPPDRGYAFGGISGDIPLAGVWQGNVSSVYASAGIYRPVNGLFILDTANNGTAGTVYSFMSQQAGDIPVAGDWSGSGTTKIGIYRPSTGTWYLDYNGDGVYDAGDMTYQFGGIAGDVPVVGDWSGSGRSKIGIFRQGFLWLLDSNGDGQYDAGDAAFAYGGIAGDVPVAGDWTGSGRTNVGVFRQGFLWVLDANGDQVIDAGDLGFAFGGITGDIPVVGKWNPELNVPPSTPNTLSVTCSGVSCGSTTPGSTSQFTFTYNDPVNGSNNIQYGQVWLADSAGGVHCQSEWGNNGALDLFDGNPSSASRPNTTLSDSFCSISLASVATVSTTALAVTLNMSFLPGAAGTYSVMSAVYDLDGDASTFGTLGTFTVDATPLMFSNVLPVGIMQAPYSAALSASGGTPPYTWSLAAGSALPIGLALSASGVVSGTPTFGGSYNFTAQVMDSAGTTVTQIVTIDIVGALGPASNEYFTTINGAPAIVTIVVSLPSDLNVYNFIGNNYPDGVPLACGGASGLNGYYSVTIDGVDSFSFAVSGVSAGTFSCALGGAIGVTLQITVLSCGPTISAGGIQINQQATNTIINGASGIMNIYGTCLAPSPVVTVDGTGVQITGYQSTSGTQINAFYQVSPSAAPGQHNVRVTTAGGTSNSQPVFATSVTLLSFSFATGGTTGGVAYWRDCMGNATYIALPTWPATNVVPGSNPPTPVACPQELGYTGDHAIYASGSTMAGLATFGLNPAPQQAVAGVYVQGTTGSFGTFTASNVTIPAGSATFQASVTDSTALAASMTQFINPLGIAWSVGPSGTSCTGCVAVGSSSNPVFVTLAASVLPAKFGPTMLTYASLAVGAGGATTQSAALANTWAQFSTGSGPANVTTWDRRSMSYYSGGFSACALNAQDVVQNLTTPTSPGQPQTTSTNAQCGAFAYLLESALATNGIHSNWTQVQPTDGVSRMVINNWCVVGAQGCPQGQPTYQNAVPSVAPWVYKFLLNVGDYMFPALTSYGDLTNIQGLPGQGGAGSSTPPHTPIEKVFDFHFIVQVPIASGNQYYDPSYGVTYPSQAGFESQAVAGYGAYMGSDANNGNSYHFRIYAAIPPNITFTLAAAFSM